MFFVSCYRISLVVSLLSAAVLSAQTQPSFAGDPRLIERMTPVEIVDYLLSNEVAIQVLLSVDRSRQDREALINLIVSSGQEGLEFLLQQADRAPRQDMMKFGALISSFRHAEGVNPSAIVDFIDRRGRSAITVEEIAVLYPLISNLGFFTDQEGMVESFLTGLASDAEAFTGNWAAMRPPNANSRFDPAVRAGVIQSLRGTAITALFHKNTERTLNFLEELRTNSLPGSHIRSMLDFHFDILAEFPSLEDYLQYVNERDRVIE